MNRLFFYRTGKNANSVAALAGAIEVAQGRYRIQSIAGSDALPRLLDWEVGSFGPMVKRPLPPSGENDRAGGGGGGTTVLAYSFMSVDAADVSWSLEHQRTEAWDAGGPVVRIAGGPHPSGDPRDALAMGFDHAFVGEAEGSLVDFLEGLTAGRKAPDVIRQDPDAMDPNLDRTMSFAPVAGILAPIELSRGCPYACQFCHVPWVQGRRMRHRGVESVLEHVRISLERGRSRTWFVTSDAFAYGSPDGGQGDPAAIRRLLTEVKSAGMKEVYFGSFPSEVRPDHVNEELVELVATHCTNSTLVIGAQSGSEEVLRRLIRGHGVEVVRKAVRTTVQFGLIPHVDFILGLPGETYAERQMTLELIHEITGDHRGRVHVHYFMPHAGTPYATSRPQPVEPEIIDAIERLTGARRADGYWRRQRAVAARANALVAPPPAPAPAAGSDG